MNPITFQIQIDHDYRDYSEQELKNLLTAMHTFADWVKANRSQMYLGENSYNGEPL